MKEANLWFSLSPSLETMPLQHDLLRFSIFQIYLGPPGFDKKRKSEKICVTVFQYYPPENGRKLKTAKNQSFLGLKNQCGRKSSYLFLMSPEKDLPLRLFWKILKS